MSVNIDPITMKKLVLIKQIFRKSIQSSRQFSNIDKIMGIIGFDLATETILNIIVSKLAPQKTKAKDFPGILQQVDSLFNENGFGTIPDRGNIVQVHNIRNDAQHEARYPNDSELNDCETYTRDFLKKIIKIVWSVDFEHLSIVSLINDEYCKNHLEKAEQFYQNGNNIQAAQKAITSLQYAVNYVSNAITGSDPAFEKLACIDHRGNVQEARGYQKVLDKIRETLLFTSLGIDFSEYIKVKKITGEPLWINGNDEPFQFINGQDTIEKNDAEYIITYCTNAVILIENKVHSIKEPFGKEHWV